MSLSMYLSMITLNINGLNSPTKRHRVEEWIRKQNPHICCLQYTHHRLKDKHKAKSKGMEKDISCKWKGKKSEAA